MENNLVRRLLGAAKLTSSKRDGIRVTMIVGFAQVTIAVRPAKGAKPSPTTPRANRDGRPKTKAKSPRPSGSKSSTTALPSSTSSKKRGRADR